MYSSSIDVAIIGAGPFGLSLATYLRKRKIEHRIFGTPMQTWRNMSPGMFLKSLGFATNIYVPQPHFTLPDYCRMQQQEDYEPIEIAAFARYGVWVQQQLIPEVEETEVADLRPLNKHFVVTLGSGEQVRAKRVVIAVGLTYFEQLPEVFSALPKELASHTARHSDFAPFNGLDVTVVGGGQSALQAAALLHEHGAKVRMIVRGTVHWGDRGPKDAERSLIDRVRMPVSVLGHGRDNWVLQHFPMLQHYLSTEKRLQYVQTHLGPGGAWWLRGRVENQFPILTRTRFLEATRKNGKVALCVAEDSKDIQEIMTDHVIAGTGYKVDVDRMSFISEALRKNISRLAQAPRLSRHFQSSVPGLYFIGPASAASFGPLFRFVAGSAYTAPTVARHLAWSSGFNLGRSRSNPSDFEAGEAIPAVSGVGKDRLEELEQVYTKN